MLEVGEVFSGFETVETDVRPRGKDLLGGGRGDAQGSEPKLNCNNEGRKQETQETDRPHFDDRGAQPRVKEAVRAMTESVAFVERQRLMCVNLSMRSSSSKVVEAMWACSCVR